MDLRNKVLILCGEMAACDAKLAQYVDHNGDENGPTFDLWNDGVDDFDLQCKAAIKQHAIAIALWEKMQKLNKLRRIAENQKIADVHDADKVEAVVNRTLRSLNSAIQRCHNPKNPAYGDYGARGITVCNHWRDHYMQFIADMGLRLGRLTLDRIDNDKGYLCPKCSPPGGNCRWATYDTQRANQRPRKRKARTYTQRGEKMRAWWAEQSIEVRQNRMAKAQSLAGDALNEWRAKKTTECLRCGYKWAKTIKTRSKMCPKCHSSLWDKAPTVKSEDDAA